MKRFNRIFACLLAVALLACACSGCGKKSEEPSVNGADAKNERYYAPLTGEPLSSKPANTRPFAVMINNIVFAQPQVGISNTDMIYADTASHTKTGRNTAEGTGRTTQKTP